MAVPDVTSAPMASHKVGLHSQDAGPGAAPAVVVDRLIIRACNTEDSPQIVVVGLRSSASKRQGFVVGAVFSS